MESKVKESRKTESSTSVSVQVLILHVKPDFELAKNLGKLLKEKGIFVFLSGDLLEKLRSDHPKLAIDLQEKVDFVVPVVTDAFIDQVVKHKKDQCETNCDESEVNCFMYDLALKEYSRAYSINYRVRPVCDNLEIERKVGYQPLLQTCFLLWNEVDDLAQNLLKTKSYLLDIYGDTNLIASNLLPLYGSISRPIKPTPVNTTSEFNDDKKKIIFKLQPPPVAHVPRGSELSLSCAAISYYPLEYQWYKNSKIIEGETRSILILSDYFFPDCSTGETFQCYCEVSNKYQKMHSLTTNVTHVDANFPTHFEAEDKVALLIANDKCDNEAILQSPKGDAALIARKLHSINFKVILVRNLSREEMLSVIHAFCEMLRPCSYALFFFAGHGFEAWGQTYLLPVDCSDKCLMEECISKEYVLEHMQSRNLALNVLLIDACRKPTCEKPLQLPKMSEASMKGNTVIGYATNYLGFAHEPCRKGFNSYFVKYLKKYIEQDISIQTVIQNVQIGIANDKNTRIEDQHPVIESSLRFPLKLIDPIRNSASTNGFWSFLKKKTYSFNIEELNITVHLIKNCCMYVYLNGIVISAYLQTGETEINTIHDLEINLNFSSEGLVSYPDKGCHLKNVELKAKEEIELFHKLIFGLQKSEGLNLDGELLLKSKSKNPEITIKFSIQNNMNCFLKKFEGKSCSICEKEKEELQYQNL